MKKKLPLGQLKLDTPIAAHADFIVSLIQRLEFTKASRRQTIRRDAFLDEE